MPGSYYPLIDDRTHVLDAMQMVDRAEECFQGPQITIYTSRNRP